MTPKIRIDNRNKAFKLNEKFIKRLALEVLGILKRPGMAELEIVFLGDKGIRALNKRYKKVDRPTDVLSFNIDAGELEPGAFFGEIFISSDMALANAGRFGTLFEEELALYVIHGILHLFGYEDYTPRDRARMSKKQGVILKCLCTKTDLSKVLMRR
jgi:probable rRNA maturation factor